MIKKLLNRLSPQQNLFLGFFAYMLLGSLLLAMPFAQKTAVGLLDCLFMATSALSTTGLATVSTYDSYNFFGQGVILLLIQIGGIGYMTFSSFVLLSNKNNLTEWRQRVLNAEFSLPQGFSIHDFVKATIIFTVTVEAIGAILLFVGFKMQGVETGFAIWSSIFHSISAFCTAGFGLYNDSFEQFKFDVYLNSIISILSILGALGFIVATDVWYKYRYKGRHITFTSKVIVGVFTALTGAVTLFMFFAEPSIQAMSWGDRLMVSFFQAMTAITTVGFNTVPIGTLSVPVLMAIVFLMYVGASPSGTGGGLKSTTLTAAIAVVLSRIKGSTNVYFWGKQIPTERVAVATASIILYTGFIFLGVFLLTISEAQPMHTLLFEAASALGTVGLSTGITGTLSVMGKFVIISLMFVGRLGVLTLGLALFAQRAVSPSQTSKIHEEDIAV